MTLAQQRRFFFPRFTAACKSLGWSEASGRLTIDEARLNLHGRKALDAATARALAEHRAPTLSDLRHGCIIAAIGKDKDTLKLNNREQNLILDFLKLCQSAEDLGAELRRSNPENYDREALVIRIHKLKVPEAVIEDVCRRSFAPVYSHPYWEDLPLPELRGLVGILTEITVRTTASAARTSTASQKL